MQFVVMNTKLDLEQLKNALPLYFRTLKFSCHVATCCKQSTELLFTLFLLKLNGKILTFKAVYRLL